MGGEGELLFGTGMHKGKLVMQDNTSDETNLSRLQAISQEESSKSSAGGIGARVTRKKRPEKERGDAPPDADLESLTLRELGVTVAGLAVSWQHGGGGGGEHVVYYLPFSYSDKVQGEPCPSKVVFNRN